MQFQAAQAAEEDKTSELAARVDALQVVLGFVAQLADGAVSELAFAFASHDYDGLLRELARKLDT